MADFLENIFGSKPQVAPYTPTDLPTEQLNAILADISAFPDIQNLGGLYEQYMLDSYQNAGFDLKPILQGGEAMTKQMESLATDFMSGNIPQDVQDQLRRQDAFTSLLSGGPGGASALTSRDLGLTSLDLISRGAQLAGEAGNSAQRWAGLASGLIMSPSGMMITPQQQAQMQMQNRLYAQATKQFGYNVAAAPNPVWKGISDLVASETAAYLGSLGGGGMGGGGKGGTVSPPAANWGSPNLSQGVGGDYGGAGFNFGGVPSVAATSGNIFNTGGDVYGGIPPYTVGGPYVYPGSEMGGPTGMDLTSMLSYQTNFAGGY